MVTPTMVSPFEQALEYVEQLSTTDQEALLEIVGRRLSEQRRRQIAANAQNTQAAFRAGQAASGTVDDLFRDLDREP